MLRIEQRELSAHELDAPSIRRRWRAPAYVANAATHGDRETGDMRRWDLAAVHGGSQDAAR